MGSWVGGVVAGVVGGVVGPDVLPPPYTGGVGLMCTMPLGSTEMPGTGVPELDSGVGESRTVPLDRCSTCCDGAPGFGDTNVSQVSPLSLNASGAALLST